MKSLVVFVALVCLCAAFNLPKISLDAPAATTGNDPCDAEAETECANNYASCVNDTTSMDTVCECIGDYGLCLYDCECLDVDSYNDFITSCINDVGCPAYYCGTPITSSGSVTTGSPQACDNDDIIDCVNLLAIVPVEKHLQKIFANAMETMGFA